MLKFYVSLLPKNKKTQKCKRNKIKREGFVVEVIEEEEELVIQFQASEHKVQK